jgi:DUF971 family protein
MEARLHLKMFKRISPDQIACAWTDGHHGIISLRTLRDRCPCAGCAGESVLFQTYVPPRADTETPGRYELRTAAPVGNYALKLDWGDGHGEGIYTWEHLRSLCECVQCHARKASGGNGEDHG